MTAAAAPPVAPFLSQLREQTDTVLLSFSRGKDSLSTWCILLEAGFRVVPFYMELVPGMAFVTDYLDYCEEVFGAHIYRTIHPGRYYWLNGLVGQPPWTRAAIASCNLPKFDMDDVARGIKRTAGLPKDTWHAIGTSAHDSSQRRVQMERYQGIDGPHRRVYPIWNLLKAEKIATLNRHNVKLPIDYEWFGRSYDGLDWWYLQPIRKNAPEDFQRILALFPMIEVEIARKEFRDVHLRGKAGK